MTIDNRTSWERAQDAIAKALRAQLKASRSSKSPRELGRESAGQDVDCPFAQYDEDTSAWDEWHEGREEAEHEMGDEYADYCDPSMRDCYE